MNNKEWINFEKIIKSRKHICINISTFTDLLRIPAGSEISLDPCSERDLMKLGFYGLFSSGTMCYVSKYVPPNCLFVFLGKGLPKDNISKEWSAPVPIELLDNEETLNRLLNLKAFW